MAHGKDHIYESAAASPTDDFWLKQGHLMVAQSLSQVRAASNSLITALGVIQGIYLGVLGFSNYIPNELPIYRKSIFVLPIFIWLIALYYFIQVVLTQKLTLYLHSPDHVEELATQLILEKQRLLNRGFALFVTGMILTMVLFILRLHL